MIRHEFIELAEDCAERSGLYGHRFTEMAKLRCQTGNTWARWIIKMTIGKEI